MLMATMDDMNASFNTPSSTQYQAVQKGFAMCGQAPPNSQYTMDKWKEHLEKLSIDAVYKVLLEGKQVCDVDVEVQPGVDDGTPTAATIDGDSVSPSGGATPESMTRYQPIMRRVADLFDDDTEATYDVDPLAATAGSSGYDSGSDEGGEGGWGCSENGEPNAVGGTCEWVPTASQQSQ
eukprot:GHVU01209209.1.p2 GENE.GHVU01209209.1~~GHVU01209209.1.p2  ORF type:complete len:179 (+),score=34.48 GHVU01209209.1:752-1288(+)